MPEDDGGQIAELRGQVEDLQATVRRLETEMEDLAVATLIGGANRENAPAATHYPDLDTWVRDYFAPLYARPVGGEFRWCAQWRDHVEAVARLEAMWRAWEVLRLNPGTGMAGWFTSVADPLVIQLMSRSGTFAQCTLSRHMSIDPQACKVDCIEP